MKLKLAELNNMGEGSFSISELRDDENLKLLLKFGLNYASSADGNPMWQEGDVVNTILGTSSTHFLLLPNESYLFIES